MNAHQKLIKDNVRSILKIIARHYGCNYSPALYRLLKIHPDYPSFLSFQYLLERIGKESFAVQTNYENLLTMPMPCIVHVFTNMDLFLFINHITLEYVFVENENGNMERIAREDFIAMWDGNTLLMDELKGNIHFSFKERLDAIVNQLSIPFLISCMFLVVMSLFFIRQERSTWFYLYCVGIFCGLASCIFLLIEQIDKHNILVKKLCSSRKRKKQIDCSSILDFKGAYFLGLISWTDIGLTYFLILLITLFAFPFEISRTFINVFSWGSIGYVCYSIFYQKFIAQRWCTFCLAVQGVFVFFFTLSLCTFQISDIWLLFCIRNIIGMSTIVLSVISIYIVIKPLLVNQKKYTSLQNKYNNLIFDEHISHFLFSKEKHVENLENVYKMKIGNKEAKEHLTLIFDPTCSICIKDLQILLPIFQRKRNLTLDLIFFVDEIKEANSFALAEWLMQKYINSANDFMSILRWYIEKYPISKNQLLKRNNIYVNDCVREKLKQQNEWCRAQGFYSTPILLINETKLPEYYNIANLDYLCT